ncbi:MAG: hypothetical protein O8C67_15735 [Candidatus Methanoperedens sp.]|nr:hypothetical protein [Candidatus Methanoperedens sp.]
MLKYLVVKGYKGDKDMITRSLTSKTCAKCKIDLPYSAFSKNKWAFDGYNYWCRVCRSLWCKEHREERSRQNREYRHRTGKFKPYQESKECNLYLGIHIAERVLSKYFDDIERMPFHTQGYDFICNKGYKIDVKSSCLRLTKIKSKTGEIYPSRWWSFKLSRNKIADYFLCLAFDNRQDLNPLHLWLIPGQVVNHLSVLGITANQIKSWTEFERPLEKVLNCCAELKQVSVISQIVEYGQDIPA